ncbi:MAG: hypothetical protein ACLSA6_15190 [Holdemania massiliensis]
MIVADLLKLSRLSMNTLALTPSACELTPLFESLIKEPVRRLNSEGQY